MIECLSLQISHVFKAIENREPDTIGCCSLCVAPKWAGKKTIVGSRRDMCPTAP